MKTKLGFSVKPILMVILLSGISLLAYQNCSSSHSFSATDKLSSLVDDTQPVVPQYATKIAGDAESFPPLKLLFVVDNSGTMEVNQINLASAFDRMFAGTNATNLAPFDTTAFVISTSQYSPDKTSSIFGKLPTQAAETFISGANDYQAQRNPKLTGLIPGDLVGYGLSTSTQPDRTITSFYPAPVALYRAGVGGSTAVSRYAHKSQNGSVDEFSGDFKDRLALLNPVKSAIDPVTTRGVLDDVVDRESGLCAVARVLKNNQGFVQPGDLASIIIVSDENDQDASGRSCYDSIITAKSGVDYVDGRCEGPQTNLQYRAEVPDPSKAKCKVDYQTGFTYRIDYKLPTTDIKYYTKSMRYDQLRTDVTYFTSSQQFEQLRTSVSYYTSSMTYDLIETPVTYYTKSPTYSVPQTNVKYYTEVESCTIRDGIKTNCTYSYPSATVTLSGDSKNQCATFVAGKLPSGALYTKSGYEPVCSAGTPVAKSGACSATDPNVINCQQNYSSPKTVQLTGKVTSTCDAFAAGRLPAGALTSAAVDPGYTPSCGNLIVTSGKVGSCTVNDPDKQNCKTVYTAAASPVVLNGIPGANSCAVFATGKLPAGAVYSAPGYLPTCTAASSITLTGACSATDPNVSNCRTVYSAAQKATLNGRVTTGTCESTFKSKLPSNTVLGNASYPITCADGPTLADVNGNCSATDPNIANCRTVFSASTTTLNVEGVVTNGMSCATFANGRLPSNAAINDAGYEPSCAAGASKDRNVTGTEGYVKWPAFTAVVGSACSTDVRDGLVTSRGLLVAGGTTPVCTVTALTSASQTLADSTKDLTCAVANWKNVCDSSNSAFRNCTPTDIAAGEKYETLPKTVAYEGSFTCDTLCSKTTFCKDKAGTVGDNYYQCQVSNAAPLVKSVFVLEPQGTPSCKTGENRIITNGPYKTSDTKPAYVAGAKSDANSATALSEMIVERSRELFKESLPIMSVFVRQPGDSLGTNGSLGSEYNRLADMLGGKKLSVLSSADQYASALQDLSGKIRERLGQSVNFREVAAGQAIRKVWLRPKGAADFTLVSPSLWSASGGTITLSAALSFTYGDEFKIEYW